MVRAHCAITFTVLHVIQNGRRACSVVPHFGGTAGRRSLIGTTET
jgi:hypothetical protein